MNLDKIGKFLAFLRKEKGLTQEELGLKLETGREQISKWERGVSLPNPSFLIALSKFYNVSVNEILLGERDATQNNAKLNEVTLDILKAGDKRFHKVLKILVMQIVLLFIVVFGYYFFSNYHRLYVYRLSGDSKNYELVSGLAVFSSGKNYLTLGNIVSKNDSPYQSIEVFYYDKEGVKKTILEASDEDYTLVSISGYDDYFPYRARSQIINNTYLTLKTTTSEETFKIEFIDS